MNDGHKLFIGSILMLCIGALMLPYGGAVEIFGWHGIAGGAWWALGFAAWAMTPKTEIHNEPTTKTR